MTVISGAWCVVERCVAFAERNDLRVLIKWEKFAETPDATAVARIERCTALLPETSERNRLDFFAALYIKQAAATRADVKASIEIEFGPTVWIYTALVKMIRQRESLLQDFRIYRIYMIILKIL